jgi:hypothetical protein
VCSSDLPQVKSDHPYFQAASASWTCLSSRFASLRACFCSVILCWMPCLGLCGFLAGPRDAAGAGSRAPSMLGHLRARLRVTAVHAVRVWRVRDVKYSMYVVAERILWLETHDESAGRVYRRHGRVAVDRIGHLSSGTTPPHTTTKKATQTPPLTQGFSMAPLVARAHDMT